MFKHLFDNAQDIAAYPAFSLIVFFAFFTGVIIWVMRVNKKYVETMKQLPLDEKDAEKTD